MTSTAIPLPPVARACSTGLAMPIIHRAAHRLIAETAKAMAHELYDTMMSDNEWYGVWKARWPGLSSKALEVKFVVLNTAKLLPGARELLVGMLTAPGTPEAMKTEIAEALIADASLTQGRSRGMKPATQVLRHAN